MKTTIIWALLLSYTLVFAQLRLPIATTIIRNTDKVTIPEPTPLPTVTSATLVRTPILKTLSLPTIDAYEYKGEAIISIQDGVSDEMWYFITFFPWEENCQYEKCYYGFVNNYTAKNEITLENQTFVGYGNDQLEEQPIFKFGVNSKEDYSIKYSPKLQPIFKEIIELSCQKFNPIFQNRPVRIPTSFVAPIKISTSLARPDIRIPSQVQPLPSEPPQLEYNFRTLRSNEQAKLLYGSKIAQRTDNVRLQQTDFRQSIVRQSIIQRDDGLVGSNKQIYSFDLGGDSEQELLHFKGDVQIDILFQRSLKLLKVTAQKIVNEIEEEKNQRTRFAEFAALDLNKARRIGISQLTDIIPSVDTNSLPGSSDPDNFPGETYSGVNVVEQFKKAKPKPPIVGTITNLAIQRPNRLGRRLQGVVSVKNIYDYKKTLYEKKIIGKTFKVQFRVDCDYIILTNDHQIRCRGWADFKFFNQNKSLKLFDFTKSVSIIWQFNKPITGEWASSVWVGLPKPKILGFKFDIKIKYEIILDLNSKVIDYSPFTVQVQAIANAKATTDSSAAIRILVVEGGVFIKGTLVRGKTDPKVTAVFDFPGQKITLKVLWYAELYAFEADWGFFYRVWRLFKGWTGKKIIKKWPIDSIYKKWKLYENTLVINI